MGLGPCMDPRESTRPNPPCGYLASTMGINRHSTYRLGQVAPGKPVPGQTGIGLLLLWPRLPCSVGQSLSEAISEGQRQMGEMADARSCTPLQLGAGKCWLLLRHFTACPLPLHEAESIGTFTSCSRAGASLPMHCLQLALPP